MTSACSCDLLEKVNALWSRERHLFRVAETTRKHLKINTDWDHWNNYLTTDNASSWGRYRRQEMDQWQPIVKGQAIELSDGMEIIIHAGTCLAWDTLITMADGTKKMIKDVRVGDMVMTPKGVDKVIYADGEENKTYDESDIWTFSDGTVVRTVHRHRFFNSEDQSFQYMDKWKAGEHAKHENGGYPSLVSHGRIHGDIQHCTIFTENFNLYYANGLLSGNRMSNYFEVSP